MSDEGGQAAYNAVVKLNKELYGKDALGLALANNNFLGNNILKEDLGVYKEPSSLMFGDDLDERTRDRLISNTRQDVASTFAHAQSAFQAAYAAKEDARRTKHLARWLILFAVFQILLSLVIFWVIA
jgi:hypothetical protein